MGSWKAPGPASESNGTANWINVLCSNDGRVTAVQLSSVGVTGPISPALGNLSALTVLDLSYNQL